MLYTLAPGRPCHCYTTSSVPAPPAHHHHLYSSTCASTATSPTVGSSEPVNHSPLPISPLAHPLFVPRVLSTPLSRLPCHIRTLLLHSRMHLAAVAHLHHEPNCSLVRRAADVARPPHAAPVWRRPCHHRGSLGKRFARYMRIAVDSRMSWRLLPMRRTGTVPAGVSIGVGNVWAAASNSEGFSETRMVARP